MNILPCDQNGHPEHQEHTNDIIVSSSIEAISGENERSIAIAHCSEDNVDSTTSHCSAENEKYHRVVESNSDKPCCMNIMLFITIFIILVVLCLVGKAILLQRRNGQQCQLGK